MGTGVLAARAGASRVALGTLSLTASARWRSTASSMLMSQPETGSLITEYGLPARRPNHRAVPPDRARRRSRAAPGHERGHSGRRSERRLLFRLHGRGADVSQYDAKGGLVFERVIQGREVDPWWRRPKRWPGRAATRVAAGAAGRPNRRGGRSGRLWISFVQPITYVFDAGGEKSAPCSSAVRVSSPRPACGSPSRGEFLVLRVLRIPAR